MIYMTVAIILNVKPTKDSLVDIFSPGKQDSNLVHCILVIGLCLSSLGISLGIDNMTFFIQLIGSASSPMVILTANLLIYIK